MEDHVHGEDGHVVIVEPDPVAEETEAVETVAEAEVKVAEIEAERDVALAKIDVQRTEAFNDGELNELRGELRALRQIVERLAPPEPEPTGTIVPEPEPVVVVDDPPTVPDGTDDETPPPPPEADAKPKAPAKRKSVWWS